MTERLHITSDANNKDIDANVYAFSKNGLLFIMSYYDDLKSGIWWWDIIAVYKVSVNARVNITTSERLDLKNLSDVDFILVRKTFTELQKENPSFYDIEINWYL